jgi:hypothetical protein
MEMSGQLQALPAAPPREEPLALDPEDEGRKLFTNLWKSQLLAGSVKLSCLLYGTQWLITMFGTAHHLS